MPILTVDDYNILSEAIKEAGNQGSLGRQYSTEHGDAEQRADLSCHHADLGAISTRHLVGASPTRADRADQHRAARHA